MPLNVRLKIRSSEPPHQQERTSRRPSRRELEELEAIFWGNISESDPVEVAEPKKPAKRKPKKVETVKKKPTPKEAKRKSAFDRLMGKDDF